MTVQRGDPITLILAAHGRLRPNCADHVAGLRAVTLLPYAARVSRLTNADSRWRRSSLRAFASVVM